MIQSDKQGTKKKGGGGYPCSPAHMAGVHYITAKATRWYYVRKHHVLLHKQAPSSPSTQLLVRALTCRKRVHRKSSEFKLQRQNLNEGTRALNKSKLGRSLSWTHCNGYCSDLDAKERALSLTCLVTCRLRSCRGETERSASGKHQKLQSPKLGWVVLFDAIFCMRHVHGGSAAAVAARWSRRLRLIMITAYLRSCCTQLIWQDQCKIWRTSTPCQPPHLATTQVPAGSSDSFVFKFGLPSVVKPILVLSVTVRIYSFRDLQLNPQRRDILEQLWDQPLFFSVPLWYNFVLEVGEGIVHSAVECGVQIPLECSSRQSVSHCYWAPWLV